MESYQDNVYIGEDCIFLMLSKVHGAHLNLHPLQSKVHGAHLNSYPLQNEGQMKGQTKICPIILS